MNNITKRPLEVIFGTDWYTDCDDCVALRVLARFHKKGYVNILGVSVDACNEYSARSVDAFLASEGLPDIEIGIDTESNVNIGEARYQPRLAAMASKYTCNSDCISAVSLYRKSLARAEGRVDIIEVGFTQVLAALLKSEPDEYSPLTGAELVHQKAGRLWCMAGNYNKPQGGFEYNLCGTEAAREGASYLFDNWQGDVTLLGFEAGEHVITGGELPKDDILSLALSDHGVPNGRSSWDPCLTLMACINDEKKSGYSTVTGVLRVDSETGANFFEETPTGKHRYVVREHGDEWYADRINAIIGTGDIASVCEAQ